MGPNINEPASIPTGRRETSLPALKSFIANFAVSKGKTEPRVINTIPNNKSEIQAAAKTLFCWYMIIVYSFNARYAAP